MSIQLTVQAEDPDVEMLLAYLQMQSHIPAHCKIGLLERAMKWLEASETAFFRCDLNLPNSARLSIHSPGLPAAPTVDTPIQRHAY